MCQVPKNLWRIYVKIVIQGVQYEAELEAEPGMDFFIIGRNCYILLANKRSKPKHIYIRAKFELRWVQNQASSGQISSKALSAVLSIYEEVHEPGLEWSMTWPALDPYGQKVIGRTLANIKVGYQFRCRYSCGAQNCYLDCKDVLAPSLFNYTEERNAPLAFQVQQ